VVNTWEPHTAQKWRNRRGVGANRVSLWPPLKTTLSCLAVIQVVKAAPLSRLHWPQWQLTGGRSAAATSTVTAPQ
jgi:hypothetical protein